MTLVDLDDPEFPTPELPPEEFLAFLRQQRRRDDRIGDLARDHVEDERRRGCPVSVADLVDQLDWEPARESFDLAVAEWRTRAIFEL
jgi:hypothetical protein